MGSYGFIITRHVNSEITNRYWNHSVKLLRKFYPEIKIVIIDDNSNQQLVKADYDYNNIEIIQSEFPGRGELLPYYYYLKNKFFENAIILHDSVFIHRRLNFGKLNGVNVLPLWHFEPDTENVENSKKILNSLINSNALFDKIKNEVKIGLLVNRWYGCFGCQSYINHNFLLHIEKKYKITNMISHILCRSDRCCLERIMGCIFSTECPNAIKLKSLLGNILVNKGFNTYYFDKYNEDIKRGKLPRVVIKVWTGR